VPVCRPPQGLVRRQEPLWAWVRAPVQALGRAQPQPPGRAVQRAQAVQLPVPVGRVEQVVQLVRAEAPAKALHPWRQPKPRP
jgi:hypothetical protein